MHMNKAFRGIKRFEVIKSRKSKIDLLSMVKWLKTPKESVAGIARADTIKNKYVQALFLDIFILSIIDAIGTSIMLMPEVMAAASNRVKNAAETILPYCICAKICGNVTNTNPAPELGSSPKENIAGKIIIPAISANNVSEKIMV